MTGWDVIWWNIMVVISGVNLLLAVFMFARSLKMKKVEPDNSRYFLILRLMGILFVSVAMYRSVFVTSYPDRLVWFDSLFNSPFIVRCLALFAELAFIGMIAAVLLKFCKDSGLNNNGSKYATLLTKTPYIAIGSIALAQPLAFFGLTTQYVILFAIEEALWALAFMSITPLVLYALKQKEHIAGYKLFLTVMAVWCVGYLSFQCFFALPFMYFAELAQDIGRVVPPDSLRVAIYEYTVTRDFDTWGGIGFIIWHSGYFSLCSWMSLLYMSAPRKR